MLRHESAFNDNVFAAGPLQPRDMPVVVDPIYWVVS